MKRTWLVPPGSGPTRMGIAFSEDMLWVEAATLCCGASMWADSGFTRGRYSGKPMLVCKQCGMRSAWKGTIPRMNYSVFALVEDGPSWVQEWIGWEDKEVTVDWV